MKKILVVVSALGLALSLTGCARTHDGPIMQKAPEPIPTIHVVCGE